ncbi:DUF4012 domain-containing protein [Bifidobacterium biavatii]|uniref:Methyl-accepting chemotaxis protein n=1 Tax=Bifidobacterium biavatii DSM 23969 TaxID=1437608 RepID=A0A086ZN39_9BIFI|nr:DUF4012 domain-containing protein [Bifidobacterium biavatii]KFI47939.1 methyl-accepting chemotaxis protein [Bifidobacterium biavatii DSM 23969]
MRQNPSQHAARTGSGKPQREPLTPARIAAYALVAATGLVLSAILFYGVSVVRMYADATELVHSGESIANSALGCGGDTDVPTASKQFVTSARALRDELNTPKWTFIRNHTAYGNDIDAARAMLDAVGNLVDGPFSDMSDVLTRLKHFSADSKTIDLSPLTDLPQVVKDARKDIAIEQQRLATVHDTRLSATTQLVSAGRSGLKSADSLLDEYDELIDLIPQLLGENGERTYLVAIYNPAELRSSGGMVGNIAPVTADHGKVTIGDFVTTTDYTYASEPLDEQNAKEAEVFGEWIWKYPQTTTMNPDYRRAAITLANLWKSQKGNEKKDVAGVIALDPVFMQSLIGATGSVTLSDGKVIDGTNTVRFFLHDLYNDHPKYEEQNKYTNAASKKIMNHVFSSLNTSTASAVLKAVRDTSASSHLKLWMKSDDEFAALVQTGVIDANAAGLLPGTETEPITGAYFSELQASKLSWYLDVSATVTKTCGKTFNAANTQLSSEQAADAPAMSTELAGVDESQLGDEYTVVLRLKNTLTEREVNELPKFVTGKEKEKKTGWMYLRTTLMAPAGGEITAISFGNAVMQANGPVEDRQFVVLDPSDTGLAPGKTDVIVYTVRVSEKAGARPLDFVTTPVIGEHGEYTGTGGAVTDECGADVPDAAEDAAENGTGDGSSSSSDGGVHAGDSGAINGTDAGSEGNGTSGSAGSAGSGASGASGTSGGKGSSSSSSSSSDGSGSALTLDSLNKLKSQIECPVSLKKLASS